MLSKKSRMVVCYAVVQKHKVANVYGFAIGD